MLYQEFYSELGKLLYAVADIDGVITQTEKEALQEIVKSELVPSEKHKDKFGTDTAYYSEIEFDYLNNSSWDAETAFNSFIDFIEDHRTAIDDKLKKTCIRIAEELAAAYGKTNKKERDLIGKLKRKIDSLDERVTGS